MKTMSVNCSCCQILFEKSIAYINQGKKRGYPNHFCSNKCSCEFNKKVNIENAKRRLEDYNSNPRKCPNCSSALPYKSKNIYCSQKCGSIYSQKNGGNHKWTKDEKGKLSNLLKKDKRCITNPRNRIKKECEYCHKEFEVILSQLNKNCCSRKCKFEWIKKYGIFKNVGRGGFRPNSGTSKKGWYKGIFCGSSWELAWVIYHLDHNIPFERNKEGFKYNWDGKIKKYYPDFILNATGEYIEIKNYKTNQVEEKIKQFPYKLKMLYKSDLAEIFTYVENKYGKNYISLYENNICHFS